MLSKLSRILISSFFLFFIILFLVSTTIAQAATATHVVISEVEVGKTGAATDEFVELYNPTASDINLANWKLTRKTTAGAESDLISTVSGTIKSHGYFLFSPSSGYSGSASADQTYLESDNSITDNNTVLIYSNGGSTLVDKIGFGTASDSETTTETNPSSGTSRERRANSTATSATMAIGGTDEFNGNGEDTDNNANDFVLRNIPQPQNSSSTLEPVPTQTPTDTTTATPTLSETPTTSTTPTSTVTTTPTPTSSISPTDTPSITATPTETLTPTISPTETPTNTPSPTETISPTPTETPTQSPSPTPTTTPTATSSPTITLSPTPTGTFPPFPFPKFQMVCRTNMINFKIFSIQYSFPMILCTLVMH